MKFLTKLVILLFATLVYSQNIPSSNIYIAENRYLLSPAWAGIGDCLQIRLLTNTNWTNVPDAPRTYSLVLNGRLSDQSGLGAIFTRDKNGFTSRHYAILSYAYHLTLDYYKDKFLSFGLSTRYSNFGVDTSEFVPDPIISGNKSVNEFNFDIGLLYRAKGLFVNLNMSNALPPNRSDFGENEPLNRQELNTHIGYNLNVGKNYVTVQPSLNHHLFFADARAETDFNLKVSKDVITWKYWAGISLRTRTDLAFDLLSITPMVGIKYHNLYFSYGYQNFYSTSGLFNQNAHMFSIGFDFLCFVSDCKCTH